VAAAAHVRHYVRVGNMRVTVEGCKRGNVYSAQLCVQAEHMPLGVVGHRMVPVRRALWFAQVEIS
jgi:hypothetical protein